MSTLNRVQPARDGLHREIARMYEAGSSTSEIAAEVGWPISRVRTALLSEGVSMRSHSEALRLVSHKLSAAAKGRKHPPRTAEQRANISAGRRKWAEENALGYRITKSGYIEYTRGPNKERLAHVIAMEERIGRRLARDECVHHIDGDPRNNDPDNLALMTRAGHMRLHRREDALAGITRERTKDGRFR